MQIFTAPFQKNKERAFLSFLLGLLFVFVLIEPVGGLLWMGKPLSVRSPLNRGIIYVFLFLLLYLFLFFISGKLLDWLIRRPFFSISLIAIFPLAAYSILGSCSRFVADDFSSATLAVTKGVWGATWDWYINWSGRFSASFFDSLTGFLGPGIMPFVTASVILVWMLGLVSVIKNFLPAESRLNRIAMAVLVSALVLIATFETTPLLSQSLYWGQGMRSVILPLVLGTFLVAVLYFRLFVKKSIPLVWMAAIGLIGFIAGGFGETYVVLQTSALFFFLGLSWIENPINWKRVFLPAILAGLVGSILAMALVVAAPGNHIRQAFFPPPPDPFNLLAISAKSLWEFVLFLFTSTIRSLHFFVLFLASALTGFLGRKNAANNNQRHNTHRISRFLQNSFWKPALFTLLCFVVLLFACFVPSAYGMSTSPPERTLVIPTFVVAVLLAILGIISGKYLSTRIDRDNLGFKRMPSRKFVMWGLVVLFSTYSFLTTRNILADLPDYRNFARVFDKADTLIRQAKAAGQDSVMVPEVHNHFGLSDYGAGTTYWLDEAVNSYYGINVIINKHMK